MANTTNFNWETPDDTDLVKDGAAAIRTLGNSIDTSFVDLKGGTTGQILSKASNTDLDYTWIANDQGDITEVQAGTGISVASGTGPIPVVTNTVATAYDAKADLIVGTGADTFSRLAVGANNTVLTADSSVSPTGLKWAAPVAGKVLQVVNATTTSSVTNSSTTFADTGLTASITPSATNSKVLVIFTQQLLFQQGNNNPQGGAQVKLLRGATDIYNSTDSSRTGSFQIDAKPGDSTVVKHQGFVSGVYLDSPSTTSSTTYKCQMALSSTASSAALLSQGNAAQSSIVLMEIGA